MKTTDTAASKSGTEAVIPVVEELPYKAIAIYPNFSDVGDALVMLNTASITSDQISLLGQEQEHWQEDTGHEWEKLKVAKGAAWGAALGAIPGLVLVTGVAFTGGAGLLVAGPMLGAMSALGMGSLAGGLMGAGSSKVDGAEVMLNLEEKVVSALRHGNWVIVVHSRTEPEAAHAQALLSNGLMSRKDESMPRERIDSVAEQETLQKLAKVVHEAFEAVGRISPLPVHEVMSDIEAIDGAELKKVAREANKKISEATDLDTARIAEVFKANAVAGVENIANRLHEESRIHRGRF
jgi:hypothetical protein